MHLVEKLWHFLHFVENDEFRFVLKCLLSQKGRLQKVPGAYFRHQQIESPCVRKPLFEQERFARLAGPQQNQGLRVIKVERAEAID